jgi:PTS system mannose-specific IIA component
VIATLILTHGPLGRELLAAAQMIAGAAKALEALCLEWSDTFEAAREKVRSTLERMDQGEGVLILTDMYGGTPSNIAMTFFAPGKVEVVSGVNLPMVLRLSCHPPLGGELTGFARWLQEKGERSHCRAGERPAFPKCEAKVMTPERGE